MTEQQIAELIAEIDAPFSKWPTEAHMVEQAIRRTMEIMAAERDDALAKLEAAQQESNLDDIKV